MSNAEKLSVVGKTETSRRDLITAAAGVAGFTFLPSRVLGRQGAVPPSQKLNIAFVGVGTRGSFNLRELDNLQQNVVAICDVDWRELPGRQYPTAIQIAQQYPKAKRFDDWRVMLQEMDKSIDAVVVATANHTHAIISMTAMKMGKHVFTEKPLCHTVEEVRGMMAFEKKYKTINQTGCQGHSSEDCRLIIEWIRDGCIGEIREVHIFQNIANNIGRQFVYSNLPKIVKEEHPIPEELKWDLWIGPAPYRGFNPTYVPGTWRSWRDFGDGVIGDYCCHSFDPVFWALDLGLPERVCSEPDEDYDFATNKQVYPNSNSVRWDFPARGVKPPVSVVWHYGAECGAIPLPKGWKQSDILPPAGGGIFFGSKGAIVYGPIYASLPLTASTGNYKPVTWGTPTKVRIFPEELERDYKQPPKTLPRPFNHWSDWVESIKAKKSAGTPFSYSGLMTETSIIGNIAATQKGRILNYDAKLGRFVNNDEANALLKASYRQGWELPT